MFVLVQYSNNDMMDRMIITYNNNTEILRDIMDIWREYDKKEGIENVFYRIEYADKFRVSLN